MGSSAPRVLVISLLGEAGSGKSTVAEFLVKNYGFTRLSLATPLKEIVRRALDLAPEQVYGDFEAKEKIDPRYNHSARWFLQRFGTEGMRAVFGENVWIDYLCRTIFDARMGGGRFVIDDLRFLNEASRLHDLAGHVLRMYTPSFEPDRTHSAIFKLTGVQQGNADRLHASEAEASRIPSEWIFETVIAEKSPGAKVLLERFEEAFLRYAKTLPLDAIAHVLDLKTVDDPVDDDRSCP